MDHQYEKLFSTVKTPEPPAGLTEKILLRIARRERRVLAAKIAASACIFGVSVGIAVAGYVNLMAALSQSGFFAFASLAFSNFSSIAANLPDFILSIVETFPVFTAALALGGVLFSIWSMAALIDETSLYRSKKFFAIE